MTLRASRWIHKTAESGPAAGARLLAADRSQGGAATRVVADLLESLETPLDAIVIATTAGDPGYPLDPHGALRRAVHRAFAPAAGTVVVSAGERSVAAGLLESGLRLRGDARAVGLVFIDWVSPAEFGAAVLFASSGGTAISRPELSRCGAPPRRAGSERGTLVGALRLLDALDATGPSQVVLDRSPRDGMAWTALVGEPPSQSR